MKIGVAVVMMIGGGAVKEGEVEEMVEEKESETSLPSKHPTL